MGFFEKLFSNLAVPFEVANVFSAMKDIWDAFPLVFKLAVYGCFALSCLLAIMRMLF